MNICYIWSIEYLKHLNTCCCIEQTNLVFLWLWWGTTRLKTNDQSVNYLTANIFDKIFESKYLTLTKVSIDVAARLLEMFSWYWLVGAKKIFSLIARVKAFFDKCFECCPDAGFRCSEYDLINIQPAHLSSAWQFCSLTCHDCLSHAR